MNKSTKIILWVIVIVVVIGGIWYGVSRKQKEGVIKIGVIVAITGKSAPYGEMMKNGAELATTEINEKVGYQKINLLIEDSRSDNVTALTAYQKIKPEIQAFITGQSSIVLALAPVANNDKIVLFNVTAQSPDIRNTGDYVFSNINDSTVEVGDMAEFVKKQGLNNMIIFYENDDAGLGAKKVFQERFNQLGGKISIEDSFTGKAIDVRTQLEKIKRINPEGVYLPAFPENVGLILRQAEELGIKTKWFSWSVEGAEVINIAGKAADGIIYSSTAFDPEQKDAKIKQFVGDFQAKYGKAPNIYAATAYDGIYILFKAIEETNGEADSIKNYFYNMAGYSGVSGLTKFDSDGMVKKEVIIKTIKNGQFVPYEE